MREQWEGQDRRGGGSRETKAERKTVRQIGRGRERRERKNSEKEEVPGAEPHPLLLYAR